MTGVQTCALPISTIISYLIAICIPIAITLTLENSDPGWLIIYSSLYVIMYLAAALWFDEAVVTWQRPFHSLGSLVAVVLSFIFTFDEVWKNFLRANSISPLDSALIAVILITVVVLMFLCARKGRLGNLFLGTLPIFTFLGLIIDNPILVTFFFNIYLLVLSVSTIVSGIGREHLGSVNFGMLMLSALILARFFDSDFGFVARGLAFIFIGCGFLVTNIILVRKRRRVAK